MKSGSKSPRVGDKENSAEREEDVYDPTIEDNADGDEDEDEDGAIDRPEPNIVNHWQMGGGKEMVDPYLLEEEPREFGDEIITGGIEKTKQYKKPKEWNQYGSDDEL